MLSPVMLNALAAGGLMSLLLGPLGCFVVWRRMAYFGDAVSHAALLGVALSLIFNAPLTPAIFLVTLVMASLLASWMRDVRFHADTLLGFLAHGMLALGLVAVALTQEVQIDLNAFLFGDILTVGREDIAMIGVVVAIGLGLLWRSWHGLVLSTLEPNLAAVEGYRVMRLNYMLVAILAATVAVAIKIVGVLLITALLIMPAAAARPLAKSPASMACIAALCSMGSIALGLAASVALDVPSGAMIVLAAMAICIVTMLAGRLLNRA